LNPAMFESIINQSVSFCKMVLIPMVVLPILWGLIQVIEQVSTINSTTVLVFIVPWFITASTMIPPTAMLIGILAFLVMDQRYSYYMLLEMRQKALSNELIDLCICQ
jgi:hypothetical protein